MLKITGIPFEVNNFNSLSKFKFFSHIFDVDLRDLCAYDCQFYTYESIINRNKSNTKNTKQ